ncbi:MAG: bifunctional riboflavin kinase/FMN adenylyltransferase [Chloroflexota bacterium]|nr:bifunctional riboflavin kinase/FMN adenylyltransferase [Chloroflexota bacterium]
MTALGSGELPTIGPAVITLGVFDGVHRGHRHVLAATAQAARDRGAASVALVFSPHPDEVIRPGTIVDRLLPPGVTMERLRSAGVDHAIEIRFDAALRSLEPEAFLATLAPAIELRGMTMTPGSAFGRARAGTLERIAEIGAQNGWDCIAVEPLSLDGEVISSSLVRAALRDGDIERASAMIGSAPFLRGIVVHGDERGRQLGFPTANLSFTYSAALPALGIYLGRVHVPDRGVGPDHPALVSVGVRPTFHEDGRVLVEAYLLDWDGDLYDAVLDLELDTRLREERRFDDVKTLVTQMRADEADARLRLASAR